MVFDVELGLTNLKYFDYMKQLGILLYQKKKYLKLQAKLPANSDDRNCEDKLKGIDSNYYDQKIAEL